MQKRRNYVSSVIFQTKARSISSALMKFNVDYIVHNSSTHRMMNGITSKKKKKCANLSITATSEKSTDKGRIDARVHLEEEWGRGGRERIALIRTNQLQSAIIFIYPLFMYATCVCVFGIAFDIFHW